MEEVISFLDCTKAEKHQIDDLGLEKQWKVGALGIILRHELAILETY